MHALHAYSGMQHYSTTGRVLACTSSSYPPSTYSYGALLVMQRIMSFCLLVHTLHSTRGMTDYAPIHERKEARGSMPFLPFPLCHYTAHVMEYMHTVHSGIHTPSSHFSALRVEARNAFRQHSWVHLGSSISRHKTKIWTR